MTLVIPCSASNIAFSPGTTSISRKSCHLTRENFLVKSKKEALSLQTFLLPSLTSVRVFPKYSSECAAQHGLRVHVLAATDTGVTVGELVSAVEGEEVNETSEAQTNAVETGEAPSSVADGVTTPSAKSKHRKSETPTVKNEELVPGAIFMGKVRSIQPFGAFVDFGAYTDGLVHISRLSDNYVNDVGSVVSIGQEVKVRLVEANIETGRIALTMRDGAPSASSDNPRPGRGTTSKSSQERGVIQKNSKFSIGQDLQGTVKNLTRVGAFISLPEEEGFLPTSEESDDGLANMMGGSALQVGQEINVRVLRISRGGQVTLTMKKEEVEGLNSKLVQGVVHAATNPFMLAFSKNKDIAKFLDETKSAETS